jgi:hypothetical protein
VISLVIQLGHLMWGSYRPWRSRLNCELLLVSCGLERGGAAACNRMPATEEKG